MSGQTSRLQVLRLTGGKAERLRDVLVRESPVTIFLNDEEIANLMCSPKDMDSLAVGFLFAEGLVARRGDLKKVVADEEEGVVWVETKKVMESSQETIAKRFITTGCGRGLTFVDPSQRVESLRNESRLKLNADSVPMLMMELLLRSRLYRLTGGAHSAAICSSRKILVFNEDIGRHSAIDKVVGECILRGIKTADRIMVTSGRISSEILLKAARSRIPIIISKAAPTDLAVRLAGEFGITLVGFARGKRMNIYSNEWRIVTRKS